MNHLELSILVGWLDGWLVGWFQQKVQNKVIVFSRLINLTSELAEHQIKAVEGQYQGTLGPLPSRQPNIALYYNKMKKALVP